MIDLFSTSLSDLQDDRYKITFVAYIIDGDGNNDETMILLKLQYAVKSTTYEGGLKSS